MRNSEHAVIRMDYGNIAAAQSAGNSSFFSRRITLPIITTVQKTLTCQKLDVQPTASTGEDPRTASSTSTGFDARTKHRNVLTRHQNSFRHDRASQDHLADVFAKSRGRMDTCLASVVFTNPSDQALEVYLEQSQDTEGKSAAFRPRGSLPERWWILTIIPDDFSETPLVSSRLLAAGASAR